MRHVMQASMLIVAIILLTPIVYSTSIGISPARIIEDHALAGSTITEVITITKDVIQNVNTKVSHQGKVSEWIQFPKEIQLQKSTTSLPLTIIVPKNTPTGTYTGVIQFTFESTHNSVHTAFETTLSISVTEKEHTEYYIRETRVTKEHKSDNKEKDTTLTFTIINKGNTPFDPKEVSVTILNNLKNKVFSDTTLPVEITEPFSEKRYELSFSTDLQEGNYWANVEFSKDSKTAPHTEMVVVGFEEEANEIEEKERASQEAEEKEQQKQVKNETAGTDKYAKLFIILGVVAIMILIQKNQHAIRGHKKIKSNRASRKKK